MPGPYSKAGPIPKSGWATQIALSEEKIGIKIKRRKGGLRRGYERGGRGDNAKLNKYRELRVES